MISLWQALKNKKMAKPNHFCWADIWTFWYFDVSVWSDEKKMGFSRLCQNSVTAPYCKDWEARYPPNASERLRCPWIPLRYPQTPTKHPLDTPQISPENTWRQQTQRGSFRHPNTDRWCLSVSGSVCWRLLLSLSISCCAVPAQFQPNSSSW